MSTGISIDKCPHGMFAISVFNDEKGIATRLTQTKCCGRWDEVKRWPMTPEQLQQMANEILEFATEYSKMKLSQWHDGSVKPVHIGVYERSFPHALLNVNYYSFWDGKVWFGNAVSVPSEALACRRTISALQQQRWRGIVK